MVTKPIPFDAPMVQAILNGCKTQTRQVITPQTGIYDNEDANGDYAGILKNGHRYSLTDKLKISRRDGTACAPWNVDEFIQKCAKYKVGDILWVRETWQPSCCVTNEYCYKASLPTCVKYDTTCKWKSSTHMPEAAARIFLRVTEVRVERLDKISLDDCLAEGIINNGIAQPSFDEAKLAFSELWDIKNANRGFGWESNPWVWVYIFEKINNPT